MSAVLYRLDEPDIEEINSTLDSGTDGSADLEAIAAREARGRGFRFGFGVVTLVAAGLAFLYLGADEIESRSGFAPTAISPLGESPAPTH